MRDDSYTDAEFQAAFRYILSNLEAGRTPSKEPNCFLIVGQPGAGKTTLADIISRQSEGNVIFISGDDYRKYHPKFLEFHHQYGDHAVQHTQEFAGKMTEAVIDVLSKKGFNLIIEGTLRTKDVPIQTKNLLLSRGYHVSLSVILVRPEISFLSTKKRYWMMKKLGAIPRMTPKEHHDMVCRRLPKNLSDFYVSREFKEIQIYDRQENLLYDLERDFQKNPGEMILQEWRKPLTRTEVHNIFRDYEQYTSRDTIKNTIDFYGRFFF